MNTAQWLFEYTALQMKEEDEAQTTRAIFEASAKLFKAMLVNLLGLRPIPGDDPEATDDIIPLTWLCGNPHVMSHFAKQLEQEHAAEEAAGDDNFDALSERIMQAVTGQQTSFDDGDMLPIITQPIDENSYVKSDEYKRALRDMGIRERSTPEEAMEIAYPPDGRD